jgi:transcriptional regulator with GAF, ATPase, and Fis domain
LQPGERLRVGRDPGCDLVIDHPSVSRQHAELYRDGERWHVRDLGSKNGSFVDGIAISDHPLPEHCWLRLGDSFCDFSCFDAKQAAAMQERVLQRRELSQLLTRQVRNATGSESLPARVLNGVVELAGCCRGFLLLADPRVGDFTVQASLDMDAREIGSRAFSGSVGAVQRALGSGKPLVVNDIGSETWLASRGSVIAGGITTLVCLPLSDGREVFGAVYADRRRAPGDQGEPITSFDLELLAAFAESATLYLLAQRAMRSIDDAPRWQTIAGSLAETVPGAAS